MSAPSPASSRARLLLAAAIVAGAVIVDQLSKAWAVTHLRGRPPLTLRRGLFELDYAFNPGSAFGMFADRPEARPVFIAITVASLIYMGVLLLRLPTVAQSSPRSTRLGTVALALMSGGALGNLIDRLTRIDDARLRIADHLPFWALVQHPRELGEAIGRGRPYATIPRYGVVDFVVVYYWPGKRWPAFNVADVCLVVGVGLFLLYLAQIGRQLGRQHERAQGSAPDGRGSP